MKHVRRATSDDIFFSYKLGQSAGEKARQIDQVRGPNNVAESIVREWFSSFLSGDFRLESETHSGRPKAMLEENSKTFVGTDPSQILQKIVEKPDVDKSTVAGGFERIGKVKKPKNWVPHNVSDRQKLARLEVSSLPLLRKRNDPFLD